MFDDDKNKDELLEYFKTVPNKKLIVNLYISYMAAIEFIMHMDLDREYIEFSEMRKKNADPIKKYIEHLEANTNWEDTEH